MMYGEREREAESRTEKPNQGISSVVWNLAFGFHPRQATVLFPSYRLPVPAPRAPGLLGSREEFAESDWEVREAASNPWSAARASALPGVWRGSSGW